MGQDQAKAEAPPQPPSSSSPPKPGALPRRRSAVWLGARSPEAMAGPDLDVSSPTARRTMSHIVTGAARRAAHFRRVSANTHAKLERPRHDLIAAQKDDDDDDDDDYDPDELPDISETDDDDDDDDDEEEEGEGEEEGRVGARASAAATTVTGAAVAAVARPAGAPAGKPNLKAELQAWLNDDDDELEEVEEDDEEEEEEEGEDGSSSSSSGDDLQAYLDDDGDDDDDDGSEVATTSTKRHPLITAEKRVSVTGLSAHDLTKYLDLKQRRKGTPVLANRRAVLEDDDIADLLGDTDSEDDGALGGSRDAWQRRQPSWMGTPMQRFRKHIRRASVIHRRRRSNSTSTLYVSHTMWCPDDDMTLRSVAVGIWNLIRSGKSKPPFILRYFEPSVEQMLKLSARNPRAFQEDPTVEEIVEFMAPVFRKAQLSPECNVITLIYVERLVRKTGVIVTASNWRHILFNAMILSSKVWDDLSMINVDFTVVNPMFELGMINSMERKVLELMDWEVTVFGSEYARYYFLLRELYERHYGKQKSIVWDVQPLDMREALRLDVEPPTTLNDTTDSKQHGDGDYSPQSVMTEPGDLMSMRDGGGDGDALDSISVGSGSRSRRGSRRGSKGFLLH